jgi:cell volume regulation protein A
VVNDIEPFGLALLIAATVLSLALLSNRISSRWRVPAPVIFLLAAAAASDLIPALGRVGIGTVERIVTVALVVILFDGGMRIGARTLRAALAPVLSIGVIGTFLTAGAVAVLAHWLFGFSWPSALLLGTALAPTDPAVVFSVLGKQEIGGRAGVIIEGESGANDPVGVALLVSLLAVQTNTGWAAAGLVGAEFAVQMVVGCVVGLAGGQLLRFAMRRVQLPSEGLYPLRTLAISVGLYGLATVAHGSGFIAVFLAGIMVGDIAAPFRRDIERFHTALASLAEIIAFIVLGLTVSLSTLFTTRAWLVGLVLAVLLALVVRPLLVGPLLLATRLRAGERVFVLWAGLKGAVPILLGTYVLVGVHAQEALIYEIIFMVVAFSVLVQGGLVPTVARWCGITMRAIEPLPWTLGVRLRDQPEGARRLRIAPAAPADGRSVGTLHLAEGLWISLIIRDGRAIPVHTETTLRAGDEVLLITDPDLDDDVGALFTGTADPGHTGPPPRSA